LNLQKLVEKVEMQQAEQAEMRGVEVETQRLKRKVEMQDKAILKLRMVVILKATMHSVGMLVVMKQQAEQAAQQQAEQAAQQQAEQAAKK
jgi:hypothetical protein